MEELDIFICLKKKKNKRISKKDIGKLLKADNLNLIKKMHHYIHNRRLVWLSFFLFLSFYDSQYYFQT